VKAEIVTIGRELLDGGRVDTNTSHLGVRLAALGAEVTRATTVPDDPAAIEEVLLRALGDADVVITTGGLGPTSDDRTKHVVARVLGRSLVLDDDTLERIAAHFEELGRPMPEINVSQAMIPEGARAIENTVGTAPGLLMEQDGTLFFVLPGVPAEMKRMVESYVVPFLEGRGLKRLTEERILRTTGVPESSIAEEIEELTRRLARTEIAYTASATGVDVRVICRGDTPAEARRTADNAAERIGEKLGDAVYATGEESIEQVVGYLLEMGKKTVAVAESCTGGRLGWRLTRIPGSSEYFVGGVIAYSDDLKKRLLGVRVKTLRDHGAVSEEAALEMAEGVRGKAQSDYGVAITGIAGPGGGDDEKPVGLIFVAVSWDRGERVERFRFSGGRDTVRERAAQAALDMLRRALL
jgi:nicotinamide-nucleotide amidase